MIKNKMDIDKEKIIRLKDQNEEVSQYEEGKDKKTFKYERKAKRCKR